MAMIGTGTSVEEVYEATAANVGGGIFGLSRYYSKQLGITDMSQWFTDTWEILRLAEAGDEHATRATDFFFDGLTAVLILILTILDPERIILGGGISERPGFLEETHRRLADKISKHPNIDHNYIPDCGYAKTATAGARRESTRRMSWAEVGGRCEVGVWVGAGFCASWWGVCACWLHTLEGFPHKTGYVLVSVHIRTYSRRASFVLDVAELRRRRHVTR